MTESVKVNELLQSAEDAGNLSAQSVQALTVVDLGVQIQAGLGISVNNVKSSEVVLVTVMPDDSSSIEHAGNSQVVSDGHNLVIEALSGSKQQDSILLHTRYLNGDVLNKYCLLDQAVRMDSSNYYPNKGTPLYDQAVVLLGTVLVKSQEFAENGVPVRTVTLLVTDGHDEHSTRQTAATVQPIIQDMLMAEMHIIAAMGIDDGRTDFNQVFEEMGIRSEWILTPGNTPSEIRKAFQVFSQSAVRASQGAQSFSQAATGGFGS